MKKRDAGGGDSGGWLNTYADMVTLLLAFFAVLLSMSTTDENKFNAFIESFSALPPEEIQELIAAGSTGESPEPTSELTELYESLTEFVEENELQDDVRIQMMGDIIRVNFDSAAFFYPNEYEILPDSIAVLHSIGQAFVEFEEQIRMINILGFTATVESDTATYWMLSAERAAIVAEYFEFENGFTKEKMTVNGYGNLYPVAPNDSEENMRLNRRVELIVMGTATDTAVDIPQILEDFNQEGEPGETEASTDAQSTENLDGVESTSGTDTTSNTETPSGDTQIDSEQSGDAQAESGDEAEPQVDITPAQ